MNENEIAEMLYPLNSKQLSGLGVAIFLALREQTTIQYQWRQWEFTFLPPQLVKRNDLTEVDLTELAVMVASELLEELTYYAATV